MKQREFEVIKFCRATLDICSHGFYDKGYKYYPCEHMSKVALQNLITFGFIEEIKSDKADCNKAKKDISRKAHIVKNNLEQLHYQLLCLESHTINDLLATNARLLNDIEDIVKNIE